MTQLALSIPQSGQPNSTEDVKIANDLTSIQNVVNGNLDAANLATGIALLLQTTGSTRKIAFGSATLTWPGATPVSSDLNISHGLGTTPLFHTVFPIQLAADATSVVVNARSAPNSTQLFVHARTSTAFSPSAGATATVYWVAIG